MSLFNTNRLDLLPVPYIDFEGNTFVRVIGVCLPDYRTSRPTRQQSSLHSYLIVLNVPHKCFSIWLCVTSCTVCIELFYSCFFLQRRFSLTNIIHLNSMYFEPLFPDAA
jgi:hypothetical protein